MSGLGRELGPEGLETFRQDKLAMIDPAASAQEFWWYPCHDQEAYVDTQSEHRSSWTGSRSSVTPDESMPR